MSPVMSPVLPLPTAVAFLWGAFLLDGVLTATTPHTPQSAEQTVLSVWQGGLDQLMVFNTEVLHQLQQQLAIHRDHPMMATVQADWQRQPLPQPNVFEYLVVNALGEFIGKQILLTDGGLPSLAQCQAQIDLYLSLFFPETDHSAGRTRPHLNRQPTSHRSDPVPQHAIHLDAINPVT